MADPFTILGLSSNIISFIQFGFTVVSASKAVRDSVHGTTPEVHDLKSIVEDVQELIERVDAERKAGRALTKEERHIVEMAKECEMLVKQLQHAIDKLKIRDGASSRWLESTKIVVKGMWKRGEIDELKVRLETLVGRLRHSLSEVLQRLVAEFLFHQLFTSPELDPVVRLREYKTRIVTRTDHWAETETLQSFRS
jgi:hypothetical protein